MDLVVELSNDDTRREKFQVLNNVSFEPRAIAAFGYFVMIRNTRLSLPF